MSRQSSQSAERCLDILELLVSEPGGLGISEISQRLDLPLSATHRLAQVLVDKGYAAQPDGTLYVPTLRTAVLGLRFLAGHDVVRLAQPALDALARETRELVRLAVVEGEAMIWVAKAQGSSASLRHDPIDGRTVPLHTTAMGKAWLATMPEDVALARVEASGWRADLTGPNAIRDSGTLRRALATVRETGYATAMQESELGLCAIARVVRSRGPGRKVVGAVSIAGPSYRVDDAVLRGFLPGLVRTVDALEELWPIS